MTIVLQILPALVNGGVERGTVEMAAALTAAGHQALVASSGGPMVAEVEKAGGQHITLPLKSKNPLVMYANIARLEKLIRDHKVEIVHARSRAPAWSAYYAAKRAGVPFMTTFHNAYGAKSALKRRYNAVMAKGERIIAISHFVAEHIRQTYGLTWDKIRIIARGVDIQKFDPALVDAARVDALRHEWNVPTDKKIIMLPGRLSNWKGHKILVEAIAKLQRRDILCLMVGGGADAMKSDLEKTAKALGVADNVRVVDACRDMPAAYLVADVVASPATRPEGFGRVIIEAQAMGIPVIATSHGGAMETVVEGETGWLVPPGDVDVLSAALDKTLGLMPDERAVISARQMAHIRAHFTTEAMTRKTLNVYAELAGRVK